jgi:lysophospholipase L1-like esterase
MNASAPSSHDPVGVAVTRVACVGDSITVGVGTTGDGNAYPAVLGRLLGAGWEVKNFGSSGRTLMRAPGRGHEAYWDTPSFIASRAYAPDVVVIMLGTNDAKAPNWRGGANAYELDGRALLAAYATSAARAQPPRLFLALPPPALLASFTISPLVITNAIIPILRRLAAETGAVIIDVNGAFRPSAAPYFGAGDGRDIGDGIHPNDAGAALIAKTVAEALIRAGR